MTVAELIARLQEFPQNLKVWCTTPDDTDYHPRPQLQRRVKHHGRNGAVYFYPVEDRVVL